MKDMPRKRKSAPVKKEPALNADAVNASGLFAKAYECLELHS